MASSGLRYRPEVDGLRTIAVLPVILFHMGLETFAGGFVGVDVFFVISGYLIGTIILTEVAEGRFSLVRFYERRARRILPALFLMLAVSTPLAVLTMLPGQLAEFGANLIGTGLFVSNLTLYLQGGYFGGPAELKPLLHTWSLAVEEQFYILFPLVALMLRRWMGGWTVFAVILALSVASLALADVLSYRNPTINFYALPTRAWELGVGVLVALWLMRRPALRGAPAELASAAGLAAILAAVLLFDEDTRFPSLLATLPVFGTALLLLADGAEARVGRLLSVRPMVWIGLVSYSLYLWHQPTLAFLRLAWPEAADQALPLALAGGLSGALAWASWRYVEQPVRDRTRVGSRAMFRIAGAGIAVSVIAGALLVQTGGLIGRYPPADRMLAATSVAGNGVYVSSAYYAEVWERPVPPDRPTVMLIGDSHSQDFYNMIRAVGAFPDHAIVARYLTARCQPMLGLSEMQGQADRERCGRGIGSLTPEIVAEAGQADIVLIVASWRPWGAERIAETLAAFDRSPGTDIFVVGTKGFEEPDIRRLLALSAEERIALRLPASERLLEANALLGAALPADAFVDPLALACDAAGCPQFTPEGALISPDGSHLSPEGAAWLGRLIFEGSALARFAP